MCGFVDDTATSHDHRRCIRDALARAERRCRERGVRLTPLRRRVLELIWADHRAVKAYDLLDRLRTDTPLAKPATVYRTLAFLTEQGLIHKVESLNAYIGCSHDDHPHHRLLLICQRCGEVAERSAPGVMAALGRELDEAVFRPQGECLEIHGICRRCAAT